MGVNMAGFAISNDEAACKASKDEIIRRYLEALVYKRNGRFNSAAVDKIAVLMRSLNISVEDRKCVKASLDKKEQTGTQSMAMELPNGEVVTAKTSDLLHATSALLLNALKALAGIKDSLTLIPRSIIEPVSKMKINTLGNRNPRLHADEILLVLSISARNNPLAELAMSKLPELEHCQAHSTVILNEVDQSIYKKLKIDLTMEPVFYAHKLYVKE